MFVHRHIRLQNNTKIFSKVNRRNNVEVYINIIIWIIKTFWVKKKYSILFELIKDNLLKIIQENISLMFNSITEKAKVSAGENDEYI